MNIIHSIVRYELNFIKCILQDDSQPLVDYGGLSYGDQTCWTTLGSHQQQQVQQHQFPSMSVNVSMNMTMHGYAPIHGDAQFGCQPVIFNFFFLIAPKYIRYYFKI